MDINRYKAFTRTARRVFRKARMPRYFINSATCWVPSSHGHGAMKIGTYLGMRLSNKAKNRLIQHLPMLFAELHKTAKAAQWHGGFFFDYEILNR